jgi:hypothetical protein
VRIQSSHLILRSLFVFVSVVSSLFTAEQAIAGTESSVAADEGEKVNFRDEKRTSYALIDPLQSPCKAMLRVDETSMTCVKPSPTASAFVCDVGSFDECKTQCDKGNGRSCWQAAANRVGRWNENAGSRGREEAFPWLEKGCAAGFAPACTVFAYAVHSGSGTPVNRERGRALMQQACDMNDAPACTMIASGLRSGSAGFARDPNKAVDFYEKACSAGATNACLDGANLVHGKSKEVKKDPAREARLLEAGCKAGDSSACSRKERNERPPTPKAGAGAGKKMARGEAKGDAKGKL